ncbi:MAG TPA: phage baseplate assembly protein V [Anaerolineaceae bacterium]|nr:phage baseplate assembly protein V [Anaerolineaceae bacterium]
MQQFFGVYPAVVRNNIDPTQSGRVQVQLSTPLDPTVKNLPFWARVAALSAGSQRGTWFMPEVKDEVLVAFAGGDPRQPYVLGALWGSGGQPPETVDPANTIKSIHTRSGVRITISDQAGQEQISIHTPAGQSITLRDGPGAISIIDGNGNAITLQTSGIQVTSSSTVKMNVSQIEVNAGMLTVNSGMSKFSGVVQCDTLIASSVVGSSYTPGAGNLV